MVGLPVGKQRNWKQKKKQDKTTKKKKMAPLGATTNLKVNNLSKNYGFNNNNYTISAHKVVHILR